MPRLSSRGRFAPCLALSVLSLLGCAALSRADVPDGPTPSPKNPTLAVSVDATDIGQKLIHAKIYVPARSGALTLVYPKWIPGEHGPTGPIDNIAGLSFTAAGKTLPWKRDLYDMYTFHLNVPAGADAVQVAFDFLLSSDQSGFSASGLTTPNLANINWNQLLVYPQGRKADGVNVTASLRVPSGWKYGTALPVSRQAADTVYFQTVPLVTLIDSPVVTGRYFKAVPLTGPGETPYHEIDMVSDSDAALEMPTGQVTAYKNLVQEAGALFGARHYRDYHFLYTLSDHVASFGLEHHESSDDRMRERTLLDEPRRGSGDLLPHEFVHSWNGKYRRPYDLYTPDYQAPMRTDLLWVYEGLTEYYGKVLTARSGLWNAQDFQDDIADIAARFQHEPGKNWRPLADTADDAQVAYNSPSQWASYRRGTDFYDEMVLVWLEADTIIRQRTGGRASLDDFCKRFHGGQDTPPLVRPYTFDDVVTTLNAVAPYDWRGFLNARVNAIAPMAPLGGVVNGGWKLVYTDTQSDAGKSAEGRYHFLNLAYSLGLNLGENGQVGDTIPGMPAARAGMGPGLKVIAVNGRRYSDDVLKAAVSASKTTTAPIELLAENGEFYKTYQLDYHGGAQYPHLVRDDSKPDLVALVIKPQVTTPPPATDKPTTAVTPTPAAPLPTPSPAASAAPPQPAPAASAAPPQPAPTAKPEPQKTKP